MFERCKRHVHARLRCRMVGGDGLIVLDLAVEEIFLGMGEIATGLGLGGRELFIELRENLDTCPYNFWVTINVCGLETS